METTQTSTIVSGETRSGWRKTDTMWMLGLYGTAIGAGVGAVGGAVLTDGSTLGTLGGAALGGIIGHQTGR